ncbi:hypothetical protein WA158_004956 [Blastocystis sp. Blastoise]
MYKLANLLLLAVIFTVVYAGCPAKTIPVTFQTFKEYDNMTWIIYGFLNGSYHKFYVGEDGEYNKVSIVDYCIEESDSLTYGISASLKKANKTAPNYIRVYAAYGLFLLRVNVYDSKSVDASFSLMDSISINQQYRYTTTQPLDTWTTSSFDDSTWNTIQGGASLPNPTGKYYYRGLFNVKSSKEYAGAVLGLSYSGIVHVYINSHLIWNNEKGDTTSVFSFTTDYMRLYLNGYVLKDSNLIAIEYTPNSSPTATHFNALSYVLVANYNKMCASVIDTMSISSSPSTAGLERLIDGNVYTEWESFTAWDTIITMNMPANTFIQVNTYGISTANNATDYPNTFHVSGQDISTQPYQILSDYKNQDYEPFTEKIFDIYANFHFYSSFKLQLESKDVAHNRITTVTDFNLYVCNIVPKVFEYDSYNKLTYRNIPIYPDILPVYKGFRNITISPPLPSGYTIDPYTGGISGIDHSILPATAYTITATIPYFTSFKMDLTVDVCSYSLLKVIRDFGNSTSYTESFNITAYMTGALLVGQPPNNKDTMGKKTIYLFCAMPDDYNISLSNTINKVEQDWGEGSSLDVYIQTTENDGRLEDMSNTDLLISTSYNTLSYSNLLFSNERFVNSYSTWSYLYGTIVDNWYGIDFDDSNWQKGKGADLGGNSGIEIYRQTFQAKNFDIYGGSEIRVTFIGGIMIYINNKKVFTYRIQEPITTTSTPTGTYEETKYRLITIPSIYLQPGPNVIAILLLNPASISVKTSFDLTLRDHGYGPSEVFKNMDITIIDDEKDKVLDNHEILITSKDDEFSWVSMFTFFIPEKITGLVKIPSSFIFQGYDKDTNTWIDLLVQEHIQCEPPYKEFYLYGNMLITNQYKIAKAHSSSGLLNINKIRLYASSTSIRIPPLKTSSSTYSEYINTYITLIQPLQYTAYFNYQITPRLPNGVTFENRYGRITGLIKEILPSTVFFITATLPNRTSTTCNFTLSTNYCDSSKSFISLNFYYNPYNTRVGFGIFMGISSGLPMISATVPRYDESTLLYRSYPMCFSNGYYRFKPVYSSTETQYINSFYLGNSVGNSLASHKLSSDDLSIPIDINDCLRRRVTKYRYTTTDNTINTDWKENNFDDSQWKEDVDGEWKGTEKKLYIRTKFSLNDVYDHSAINFKFRCEGSANIYLNQELVYQTVSYDNNAYEYLFTLFMQSSYIRKSNNMLAIEIILTKQDTNSFIYEMTASYVYGGRSSIIDYYNVTSIAEDTSKPMKNAFNGYYYDPGRLIQSENPIVYVEFSRINIRWNQLFISSSDTEIPKTVSIKGRNTQEETWIQILPSTTISLYANSNKTIDVPFGIVGYKYIALDFTDTTSNAVVSGPYTIPRLAFFFKNYPYPTCPAFKSFPIVGENMYSYRLCDVGLEGYASAFCDGIRFTDFNYTNCIELKPKNLVYPHPGYVFKSNMLIDPIKPTYSNIIHSFTITPALPEGLEFDRYTGTIQGIPFYINGTNIYSVRGYNSHGSANTTIQISIESGYCKENLPYAQTNVNSIFTQKCPSGYFGSITRSCTVNSESLAEWGIVKEQCYNIYLISSIFLVLILIIILITCVIVRKIIAQKKKEMKAALKKATGNVIYNNSSEIDNADVFI